MKSKTDGFNCSEYFDECYAFGLFNSTECQILYSHEHFIVDEVKEFLRIGEIYDDHDLILGYKRNEDGIWGHYNNHWDGKFQIVSSSIKELCEGWYQRDANYWCEMNSERQWNEISNFFEINIYRYKWKAEKIRDFIEYCIENQLLTGYYIKANKTSLSISQENSFCGRSFTNMVDLIYELEKQVFVICFKTGFFDYNPKIKKYDKDNIQKAIQEINEWIKNTANN